MVKADWQHLSDELWISIFAKLQPDQPCDNQLSPECRNLSRAFCHFYILPRVCKKFLTVFNQYQDLHTLLYIGRQIDGHRLPDLFGWIKQYGKSIHRLVACCGSPFTEVALTALLYLGDGAPDFEVAYLRASAAGTYTYDKLHDSVIPVLVHFTSLTTISLDLLTNGNPSPVEFDLGDLANLPNLVKLDLANGNFFAVNTASVLTYLSLRESHVECTDECDFIPTLAKLRLEQAQLHSVHRLGVCACSSLRELTCIHSRITADFEDQSINFFEEHEWQVPDNLSCLTNLTRLDFQYVNRSAELQLTWLTDLPCLEDLRATFEVSAVDYPKSLSSLSRLTCLMVSSMLDSAHDVFDLEWGKLANLQVLELSGSLRMKESLLQLADLVQLKKVSLTCIDSSDPHSTVHIGLLAHKLGTINPGVVFSLSAK